MLRNMDDADVESMLESTFSIVIEFWDSFDRATQNRAHITLEYLMTHQARLIRNTIVNLPSLGEIAELADIETNLLKLRTPTDVGNQFQIFSRRISHENSGVVTRALVELKEYLQLHQSFLQASAVSEQPDVVVGQLVRSILDTCVKFNGSQNQISQLSAECIGLVGCLDPNRVESVREQREMVVVSNFEDAGETTDFVLYALSEAIVPTFLSTTDTVLQGYLSYIMQELLNKCEFRTVCAGVIRNGDTDCTNPTYLKWLTLPPSIQDTLTPFLTSMYSFPQSARKVEYKYPMFSQAKMPDKFYSPWLRCFVLDLLQKHNTFYTSLIFPPLCRAIRPTAMSIANFLLPYVVLYVIIDGTDQNRKEIGEELLGILTYEIPPGATQIRRDDWRLSIEVNMNSDCPL
jgi:serine/threonine-protein kinase ATR